MRCHEYCQELFNEVYLPVLTDRFSSLLPKLSAGVIGSDSEVLGADDKLSRDHSWGPGSCILLLPEQDVLQYGEAVSTELQRILPGQFGEISMEHLRPDDIRVSTIDKIYADTCDFSHPPTTLAEWADADDNSLCYASSGYIIYDPSGELNERISLFQKAYYPTDIWKWRIARSLWNLWHYGTYNSCDRLAKRGDGIGLLIGQGHFIENTLRLICLLNRRFPVYWKWLHWQFQTLPKGEDRLNSLLQELDSTDGCKDRGDVMRKICQVIRGILHEEMLLPDASWRNFMGSKDIAAQIESPQVRTLIEERESHLAAW
jgi:hypothetical protein